MSDQYTVTGVLSDGKTVVLDQSVPLISGRVRVTVEALPAAQPETTFLSKLAEIHQALRASGYRSRTKDEIDAQIQAERASWER
jgi:hypothetical protein